MQSTMHLYEVRPRKDNRGVDLISDALPFGRLWYDTPDHAVGYAIHSSRSHHAVIRVYDEAGNVLETQARGEFRERGGSTIKLEHISTWIVVATCGLLIAAAQASAPSADLPPTSNPLTPQ